MAFVFDSTAKSATANSYVSVSDADDYFAAHLDGSFWPSNNKDKQAALVMATNRLDSEVYGGQRTTREQSLQWPRRYVISRDSVGYLDDATIPAQLKQAAFEQALHYLKMKAGEFTVDENDLETLSNYKIGPIDVAIKDHIKADRIPSKVKQLLKSIGPNAWSGDGALRGVR